MSKTQLKLIKVDINFSFNLIIVIKLIQLNIASLYKTLFYIQAR